MSDDLLPEMEMPPEVPEEPDVPEPPRVMSKDNPPPAPPLVEDPIDETPQEEEGDGEVDDTEPDLPPPPRVKPIIEDDQIFKDAPPKKPKRKASEKQLAHLAKAREKANAKRKGETAERNARKKEKEVQEAVKVVKSPEAPKGLFLTKDEIFNLQHEAIEAHETKRKARKQVKKKEQEEIQKVNRVNQVVRRAIGQPDPDDIFASCFT
jgi:hypothetical protein